MSQTKCAACGKEWTDRGAEDWSVTCPGQDMPFNRRAELLGLKLGSHE
jgi:hypothetical protein